MSVELIIVQMNDDGKVLLMKILSSSSDKWIKKIGDTQTTLSLINNNHLNLTVLPTLLRKCFVTE